MQERRLVVGTGEEDLEGMLVGEGPEVGKPAASRRYRRVDYRQT